MEILNTLFNNHTLAVVVQGAVIIGVLSGALGSFAVLRQQSLLGDAISHATLPGVAFAFLITQSKSPAVLLFGAAVAGWIGTILVMLITRTTTIKRDAALGIILSVFFGLGIVLLTVVQKTPLATQAGLNKFLFGNAATLLKSDVTVMGILSVIVLTTLLLFWKEFKLLTFDYDFAKGLGYPVRFFDILLTTLIVMSIVVGLQTVGVVLMSAMLVAPGAAARQWTDKLGVMVFLAAIFGIIAGVAGAVTSSFVTQLPTGPTIVLYVSVIVFFSLFFAPNRGLVWDYVREKHNQRQIQATTLLKDLLYLAESHADLFHPHDLSALKAIGHTGILKTFIELEKRGWVNRVDQRRWALTKTGLKVAQNLKHSEETYGHTTN